MINLMAPNNPKGGLWKIELAEFYNWLNSKFLENDASLMKVYRISCILCFSQVFSKNFSNDLNENIFVISRWYKTMRNNEYNEWQKQSNIK